MASTTQRAGTGSTVARRKPAAKPAVAKVIAAPAAAAPEADYDLGAIIDQRRDALGHAGDEVTFHLGGKVFSFPHPLFATDEWKDGLTAVSGDVEFGQYVLGDQYDEFRECGGQSAHIAILMAEIRREARDLDGDDRPTPSSISSRAQRRQQRRR